MTHVRNLHIANQRQRRGLYVQDVMIQLGTKSGGMEAVFQSLPPDKLAEMMILLGIINISSWQLNKSIKNAVRRAMESDNFFQRLVQRCFPLVKSLPFDMIMEYYEKSEINYWYHVFVEKQGEMRAQNFMWGLLYLRIFDTLLNTHYFLSAGTGNSSSYQDDSRYKLFEKLSRNKFVSCDETREHFTISTRPFTFRFNPSTFHWPLIVATHGLDVAGNEWDVTPPTFQMIEDAKMQWTNFKTAAYSQHILPTDFRHSNAQNQLVQAGVVQWGLSAEPDNGGNLTIVAQLNVTWLPEHIDTHFLDNFWLTNANNEPWSPPPKYNWLYEILLGGNDG